MAITTWRPDTCGCELVCHDSPEWNARQAAHSEDERARNHHAEHGRDVKVAEHEAKMAGHKKWFEDNDHHAWHRAEFNKVCPLHLDVHPEDLFAHVRHHNSRGAAGRVGRKKSDA